MFLKNIFSINQFLDLKIQLKNLKFVFQNEKEIQCVMKFVTQPNINLMRAIVLRKNKLTALKKLEETLYVMQFVIQQSLILMMGIVT